MAYIVTAPLVVAHEPDGDVYLYAGHFVRDRQLSAGELKRLVKDRVIEELPEPDADPVEPEPAPKSRRS